MIDYFKLRKGEPTYVGVSKEKIDNAKPKLHDENFNLLKHWIRERYDIHVKKDVLKLPKPWTLDPILQKVKFTNVHRFNDRATIWLLENVCHDETVDYSTKLLNCILFRTWNNLYTADFVGMPLKASEMLDYTNTRERLVVQDKIEPDRVWYTSAFNTGGIKHVVGRETGELFMPVRPLALMGMLIKDDVCSKIRACKTPEDVCNVLLGYKGFGKFLAYQIFVDFTYIPDFPFSENTYTLSGPGCTRGLDYVFEDLDGMTHEEALFWLSDNQKELFGFDDIELNVMALENCHCEISKYIRNHHRVLEGGKPRGRVSYDGGRPQSTAKKLNIFGD